MIGLFDGLALGAAQIGAGVGKGALAGQQQRLALLRAQQQMQMMNNWHMGQLQTRRDLAGQRIDEQQRQSAGREADSIQKMLQDPAQQVNFNKFPGLQKSMMDDYVTRRNIQSGALDWKNAPPSRFTDPITGNPFPIPGADQAPGQGPWTPETSQSGAENPYLSEKGRVSEAGLDIRGATQRDASKFHNGILSDLLQRRVIEATRENAALVHQEFADTLDKAKFLFSAGHTTYEEQEKVWAKLIEAGIQEKRAGGNPADALKPLLMNHGMNGQTSPNVPAITGYLTGHGYSPDEIKNVIGGAGGGGGGAQFVSPSGPTGAPAGGAPTASGLTPDEQAAMDNGTSGLQGPAAAVKGSFQSTDGPPVLPQAGTVQAASLPGGGPPTGAQVKSAGGGGGAAGLAPFNPTAQGAGPGGVPLSAAGIPQPPPLKNPYPAGSYEAGIFDFYTGANGQHAVDGKFLLDHVKSNPALFQQVSDVIQTANTMQKQGRFSGAPVQDTLGARVPDVPDYSGMQIQMPGVMRLAPNTSTPLTLQGGFQGSFPTAPPSTPQMQAGGAGGYPGGTGGPDLTSGGGGRIGGPLPPDTYGGGGSIGGPLPPDTYGGGGRVPRPISDGPLPPLDAPIDRGPWNQGPRVSSQSDNRIGPGSTVTRGPDQSMSSTPTPPDMHYTKGPKPNSGHATGQGDTRLSRIMESLMPSGPTSGMVSRIPGVPGAAGALPPPPTQPSQPGLTSSVSPEVGQRLQASRQLPYSPGVEKFFKVNGVTDPRQQDAYYQWTTNELVPRLAGQKMGAKDIAGNIFPLLQRIARPGAAR